jgi:hypothetical protein
MQQATVNLFADMGVAAGSLVDGLVPTLPSDDHAPPTSTIVSPLPNATLPIGQAVPILVTATDVGGGRVGGVEVRINGGPWHPARRANGDQWSYAWTPNTPGAVLVEARAVDDSANLETSPANVGVDVTERDCVHDACFLWSDSPTPVVASLGYDDGLQPPEEAPAPREVGSSSMPTSRASSRACASTRARATPARTSATFGRRTSRTRPWPR